MISNMMAASFAELCRLQVKLLMVSFVVFSPNMTLWTIMIPRSSNTDVLSCPQCLIQMPGGGGGGLVGRTQDLHPGDVVCLPCETKCQHNFNTNHDLFPNLIKRQLFHSGSV